MKKQSFIFLFCMLSASFIFAQHESGAEVMRAYTESIKVADLSTDLEIKIISKNGRVQNRKLTQYIKAVPDCENCYNSIIRFEAPSDVKNTAVLILEYEAKDDDQWLFMPALRKSRRISANNRKDRFMGTEITYEDISNELSENLEDYNYELLRTEERAGRMCYVIQATATSEEEQKVTAYGKRVMWIDTETYVDMYSEFYDRDLEMIKFIKREEVRKIEGTNDYRAHFTYVENVQTGNKTEIINSNFKIDKGLEEALFTKRSLEKVSR